MDRDTARRKYDARSEETRTITGIGTALYDTDQWSTGAGAADLVAAGVQVGDQIVFETVLGTQVTGARRPGGLWIWRKTTDQLIEEHEQMLAGFERQRQEQLAANREAWTVREAALPEWLRDRLATFHQAGGDRFEAEGWGYELIVCELAALYAADDTWVTAALPIADSWERMRIDDPAPVTALAEREGTSGNQHQVAQGLALAHVRDPQRSMGGTISALSPLTGDPDYSGRGDR